MSPVPVSQKSAESTATEIETALTAEAPKASKAVKKVAAKKATPKKAAAKKAAPAKKAAVKKAPKKAAKAAVDRKPREKKEGLRSAQVRILQTLLKAGKPLDRKQIADKSKTDNASLTGYIGPLDDAKREYNDRTYFPTLITLGLVRAKIIDVNDKNHVVFEITAAGKKAVA